MGGLFTALAVSLTHQHKNYNDEDFEKFKCQYCIAGFLKKLLLANHIKENHIKGDFNNIFVKIYNTPQNGEQPKKRYLGPVKGNSFTSDNEKNTKKDASF